MGFQAISNFKVNYLKKRLDTEKCSRLQTLVSSKVPGGDTTMDTCGSSAKGAKVTYCHEIIDTMDVWTMVWCSKLGNYVCFLKSVV